MRLPNRSCYICRKRSSLNRDCGMLFGHCPHQRCPVCIGIDRLSARCSRIRVRRTCRVNCGRSAGLDAQRVQRVVRHFRPWLPPVLLHCRRRIMLFQSSARLEGVSWPRARRGWMGLVGILLGRLIDRSIPVEILASLVPSNSCIRGLAVKRLYKYRVG